MIKEHLLSRYPGEFERTVAFREFLLQICSKYVGLGLANSNFEDNLCSGNDARFWQRLSEALLANEFLEVGLDLCPTRAGPDFLIQHDGRKLWIETICPEPVNVPIEWLQSKLGEVIALPHEALLLRWTAAIKEKAEKLLGNADKGIAGYIEKGIVGVEDSYVIAVNGRLLRGQSRFASITGISQLPFAVEAVFAVGPFAIQIDRRSLKATGSGHQHRPIIKKPNGASVPADTFFDPRFSRVSAIFAADLDGSHIIGNAKPMAVIHNPNASNPVPPGLLPADWDYVATEQGNDEYLLERQPGRLG